jgi:MFS transporter, PAT family, beta-lactamase induction signal transducer AmpG
VLYKLGDAFAGSLMTPFLLKSMAYSSAEVGVVNKVIGLWLTIGGALVGRPADAQAGAVALADAVRRAAAGQQPGLLVAGRQRQGRAAGPVLPAFDWGFVKLAAPRRWTAGC